MAAIEDILAGLPPEIQQAMIAYLTGGGGMNPGNTQTGLGNTAFDQVGLNPSNAMSPGVAYGYTPQLDKYGNAQPFDLDTAAKNNNYVQDVQSNILNPAFVMQAGPGAYAPGTFDQQVITPGQQGAASMMLSRLMPPEGAPATSYDQFLAKAMAPIEMGGDGMSGPQALTAFWTVANAATPEGEALMASLPPRMITSVDGKTMEPGGPDLEAPGSLMQTIEKERLTSVDTPDEMGYGPVAQQYLEAGIPFPTEQYGQGMYDGDPTRGDRQATYDQALGGLKSAQRDARTYSDPAMRSELMQRYLDVPRYEAKPDNVVDTRVPLGANMNLDSGTGGISMGVGPNIPGLGHVGGEIDVTPRSTQSTSGRRPAQPAPGQQERRSANASARGLGSQALARKGDAKKQWAESWRALNTPEARYQDGRLQEQQRQGRTPTQDALMARQLASYLMGSYGPRG